MLHGAVDFKICTAYIAVSGGQVKLGYICSLDVLVISGN